MANLAIDENERNVLGAVTNDPAEIIKSLLVNPITGALLCEADILSTNTNIGSTILGGTAGSVLFLDIGSTLGEDNTHFFWDATNHRLGLLNNTPATTFDLGATHQFQINSTGNIVKLNNVPISFPAIQGGANTFLQNDGSGNLSWVLGTGGGYNLIQNQGVSVTQRTTINLSNLLTASDVGGKTALTIDTVNLANDNTFITNLTTNTTFLADFVTNLELDTILFNSFVTDIANNTTFITALTNNATFITDLTSNPTFITNISGAVSVVADGVTIIGDGTIGNPLVAVGGGGGGGGTYFVDQTPDNGTYGLLLGNVDGINTQYTVSQGSYITGKLEVFRNGLIQLQGATDDWVETTPGSGTFDFNVAPLAGSIITVVYQTSSSVPADEKVKVSATDTTPGYLNPKLNIHSSDTSVTVTKTITNPGINEILDYDLTNTGGGTYSNILGQANQFLPIGEYREDTSGNYSGERFFGNMFRDVGTNRIYVLMENTTTAGGTRTTEKLRIFKNDFGSYYMENEGIIIDNTTTTGGAAYSMSNVDWCTDGVYLYARVFYYKVAGPTYKIDVIRFDLDGTNPQAINIYTHIGLNPDDVTWTLKPPAGNDYFTQAMCVVGTDLYMTYSIFNVGTNHFEAKILKFAITNPVFNLALTNTYDATPGGINGRSMTYNTNNTEFYISGQGSNKTIITNYNIVGANFLPITSGTFSEFSYGVIGRGTTNQTYSLCNTEFTPTSIIIYVVDFMLDSGIKGVNTPTSSFAYWLTTYTYPTF